MTQDKFNELFKIAVKDDDHNALWAAIEQHIEGTLGALGVKHAETLIERDKQIIELKKDLCGVTHERDSLKEAAAALAAQPTPITGSTLTL